MALSRKNKSLQQIPKLFHESKCPLNHAGLPAVGEAEHLARSCYCHHCTCGKHVCPSTSKQPVASSAMYTSAYARDFKHFKPTPQPRLMTGASALHDSFSKTAYKLDAVTTHAHDFVPQVGHRPAACRPDSSLALSGPTLSTVYSKEFLNWSMSKLPAEKQRILPFRGNMLQFRSTTTYSSNFKGLKIPSQPQARKRQQSTTPILQLDTVPTQSVAQTEFADYSKLSVTMNQKQRRASQQSVCTSFSIPQKTVYQQEFGQSFPIFGLRKGLNKDTRLRLR